jgi:hypothetical protein
MVLKKWNLLGLYRYWTKFRVKASDALGYVPAVVYLPGKISEVRDQRTEGRGLRAEIRGQISEGRDQIGEVREQRSELRDKRLSRERSTTLGFKCFYCGTHHFQYLLQI